MKFQNRDEQDFWAACIQSALRAGQPAPAAINTAAAALGHFREYGGHDWPHPAIADIREAVTQVRAAMAADAAEREELRAEGRTLGRLDLVHELRELAAPHHGDSADQLRDKIANLVRREHEI